MAQRSREEWACAPHSLENNDKDDVCAWSVEMVAGVFSVIVGSTVAMWNPGTWKAGSL